MSLTPLTPTFKNIALVGATGNVGTFFLNSFKQAGSEFQVTLLTRKESESKALELVRGWPQFSVRAVDYSSESDLVDALQGQEVVLNITGSPGVRLQPAIIVAAEKAGVKWYIPSEFGGDLSKPENRSYPFYGGKFAVRDALEKSKLSYTYIANGSLADRFLTPFHGWDTKGRAVTVPGDGNTKASFTPCKDLASYTLAILRRYSQFKNTTARLASYTLSYNDWITAVQNATGNAYAVAHEPVEILRQRVAANVDNKFTPQWVADQLHISIASGDARVNWGANELDSSKLTEVKPTQLDQFLAEFFKN